jgi:hypothetical protein
MGKRLASCGGLSPSIFQDLFPFPDAVSGLAGTGFPYAASQHGLWNLGYGIVGYGIDRQSGA